MHTHTCTHTHMHTRTHTHTHTHTHTQIKYTPAGAASLRIRHPNCWKRPAQRVQQKPWSRRTPQEIHKLRTSNQRRIPPQKRSMGTSAVGCQAFGLRCWRCFLPTHALPKHVRAYESRTDAGHVHSLVNACAAGVRHYWEPKGTTAESPTESRRSIWYALPALIFIMTVLFFRVKRLYLWISVPKCWEQNSNRCVSDPELKLEFCLVGKKSISMRMRVCMRYPYVISENSTP